MNVRVDLSTPIYDGMEVVFKAPCDAAQVTGLNLYYQKDGVQESQQFAFADANANDVGDIDALFATGAVVKVILDLETNMAFIQNADTNSYLENRFKEIGGGGGGGGTTEVYTKWVDVTDMYISESDFAEMVSAFLSGKIVTICAINPIGGVSCYYCVNYTPEYFTDYDGCSTLRFHMTAGDYVYSLLVVSDGRIIEDGTNIGTMKNDINGIKDDLKDLDTALDAIIEIQNSLIGGDGV